MKTFRVVLLIAQIVLMLAMVFLMFQSWELRRAAVELNEQVEEMDSLHNAYMEKLRRIRERMVVDSMVSRPPVFDSGPVGYWRIDEGLNEEASDTSASNYAIARRFYSMFINKADTPTIADLESLAMWLQRTGCTISEEKEE